MVFPRATLVRPSPSLLRCGAVALIRWRTVIEWRRSWFPGLVALPLLLASCGPGQLPGNKFGTAADEIGETNGTTGSEAESTDADSESDEAPTSVADEGPTSGPDDQSDEAPTSTSDDAPTSSDDGSTSASTTDDE